MTAIMDGPAGDVCALSGCMGICTALLISAGQVEKQEQEISQRVQRSKMAVNGPETEPNGCEVCTVFAYNGPKTEKRQRHELSASPALDNQHDAACFQARS